MTYIPLTLNPPAFTFPFNGKRFLHKTVAVKQLKKKNSLNPTSLFYIIELLSKCKIYLNPFKLITKNLVKKVNKKWKKKKPDFISLTDKTIQKMKKLLSKHIHSAWKWLFRIPTTRIKTLDIVKRYYLFHTQDGGISHEEIQQRPSAFIKST
jgi:hypothetical protein